MTPEETATLACQRPTKAGLKRADCVCEPCKARRQVYGGNVNVLQQEDMRTKLEKAEAELARVTAEAAVLREALQDIEKHGMGVDPLVARDALSSTSAGAGLLKRLEASEAVCEAAKPVAENAFDYSTEDMRTLQEALEAWHSARGET